MRMLSRLWHRILPFYSFHSYGYHSPQDRWHRYTHLRAKLIWTKGKRKGQGDPPPGGPTGGRHKKGGDNREM